MSEPDRRKPLLLDAEDAPIDPAAISPQDAPAVPDASEMSAAARATQLAARPPSRLGQVFWGAVGALVSLMISVAAYDFITGLMIRNLWLGRMALGLAALIAVVLILIAMCELSGLARLGRVEQTRRLSAEALRAADRPQAVRALGRIEDLYRRRKDLDWARGRVAERKAEMLDADGLLTLVEREYMTGLDAQVADIARAAARNVAMATALTPVAAIDVLIALALNMRMMRDIAETYGGRSGWLGSWRLMRAVALHLIATGAVAVGDDLLGPVLGGGALAKLSRRFGEGLVNGALTARVGVAAMEVCRPLPFHALKRPSASGIVVAALKGFAGK